MIIYLKWLSYDSWELSISIVEFKIQHLLPLEIEITGKNKKQKLRDAGK